MSNLALTIFGFAIIFVMTTLGSAVVFLVRGNISGKANALFLGFAAGIMIAASVWSLIIPSIEASAVYGRLNWLPSAVGIIAGGLFMVLLDHVVPHFHPGVNLEEGPHSSIGKAAKLFLAVTIHNIPEGLSVGFAFGAAALAGTPAAYLAALGLAVGIAIQNFPEGAAVSLPMYKVTGSKIKSFWYGVGSGAVEPVAALIGYFLSSRIAGMQPWLLSFAAGAMLFVVAEDLIPDANMNENTHTGTWGVIIGFVVMMVLDVALG
ncbi:MAG: ZIP family metal transporter [Bacteroidales bacterium]|jgi:ZIP family zinc transporter|nr:ZIP family metal transporter [Bacteroidales bacterium]MCI2121373.1 ZIP family metal transporter [Bacteroidales bacterium]MCI2145508.1 ZIP family metal transporter [Bacteroidales bacterium]